MTLTCSTPSLRDLISISNKTAGIYFFFQFLVHGINFIARQLYYGNMTDLTNHRIYWEVDTFETCYKRLPNKGSGDLFRHVLGYLDNSHRLCCNANCNKKSAFYYT